MSQAIAFDLGQDGSDRASFDAEVLPHLPALRGAARRLSRDPEDLIQETYCHALAARASYRHGSNARAWLYRILTNLAVSHHRRCARDRRLEARLAEVSPASTPPPGDGDPTRARAVRLGLAQLSAADRQVIELVDLDGLRYRDVARVIGCPVGTVMSRLHRARKRLQKAIGA